MALLKIFAVVLLMAVTVWCQDSDDRYQRERKRPGEVEYDRRQDGQFDNMVGNSARRPRGNPSRSQVRDKYREQKPRLIREATNSEADQIRRDSNSISYNPYVKYMSPQEWTGLRNNLTCCPPSWNYGCESERVRMPCFYKSYQNTNGRQWCCPFYPEQTIKKCKCNRCALLKPKCAKEGRCHRRYKTKSIYAICYQNSQWNYIRYVTMHLPTSCYCKPLF